MIKNKDQAKSELILPNLKQGEELIGFFIATYTPSILWLFLIGPIMFLGTRTYVVGVSDIGLHLHKLTFLGKPNSYKFVQYSDLASIKLKKGLLQAPLKMKFTNGDKLTLAAQLIGGDKVAKLDDRTKEFLVSKSI